MSNLSVSSKWNEEMLLQARTLGDPAADALITAVLEADGLDQLNNIMMSLVRNDSILPEDMPPLVRDFLEASAEFPEWADMALIKEGEAFFDRHWPNAVLLLFCASLPNAYAAWRGAQVLYLTQRLTRQVDRRIFETAQFLLDVMAPNGLSGRGKGIVTAQKIRLIHAVTRHYIWHDPQWRSQWDDAWGLPINQEDLAGTLMTFSVQITHGLEKFGIPFTEDEANAYLHCWKVIGHIMGVDERFMPTDIVDAYDLAETILQQQKGKSEAGVALTAALIDFMERHIPLEIFDGFAASTIRHAVDADIADMLEVPPADWTNFLLKGETAVAAFFSKFTDSYTGLNTLIDHLSYALLKELVKIERGGNRTNFAIPSSLRQVF